MKTKTKTKTVIAGLSAVFVLAAVPPAVLVGERALVADEMITMMQKKFAESDIGPQIGNEEVERSIANNWRAAQTCLAEKSFPYLASSEVFARWEGRLSFWPEASAIMARASKKLETKGLINGLLC